MSALYSSLLVCVLAVATFNGVAAQTGLGIATRGWDCCKPSCSWIENTAGLLSGPVQSCNILGEPAASIEELSGCQPGGTSYACPDQQPFPSLINPDLSYATAGANIPGVPPQDACCSCYRLTFPNDPLLSQKEMVVQITNDRGNLADGQFNIHIPGAGVGINQLGCSSQFDGYPLNALRRRSGCSLMPSLLTGGCDWMFGWYGNVANPTIEYTRVQCPRILVAKTGCRRADDALFPRFAPFPGL